MVLGDFGDTREGRFEDQARDLPLRRQGYGNSRSERFSVDHEPVRRDPVTKKKIERRGTVSDQAPLARRPGVAAIAAVLGHQHPVPVAGKPPQGLGAVSDMSTIAVEICNDRMTMSWRQVPREQRQPVDRLECNFADAERREIAELGTPDIGEVEQMALKHIETADQQPIDGERRSEERVQHAREPRVRQQQKSGGGQGRPLAPAHSDARRFQLAAGGEDVAATRRAHRRRVAGSKDDVGKRLDRRIR